MARRNSLLSELRNLKNLIMQTWIYKSQRKEFTYIYLAKKDAFDIIPSQIAPILGQLAFVIELNLNQTQTLANADIDHVKARLSEQGFYLQLPATDKTVFD